MLGRPKKERKREPHEKPKATRVSKVGTIIRCRFCKGTDHNISSCSKRKETLGVSNTSARALPEYISPATPSAIVMMQGSQQSSASVGKKGQAYLPTQRARRSALGFCTHKILQLQSSMGGPPALQHRRHPRRTCDALGGPRRRSRRRVSERAPRPPEILPEAPKANPKATREGGPEVPRGSPRPPKGSPRS